MTYVAVLSVLSKTLYQLTQLLALQNSRRLKASYRLQPSHQATLGCTLMALLMGAAAMPAHAATVTASGQRVLMIEMTPALCQLQPSRSRMRQCLEGYSMTVSGLKLGYGTGCRVSSEPRLTPLQLKVVNRVMPDSSVRNQTWQHYGACGPISANNYFRMITNYASDLKLPKELTTGNTYRVSKSRFLRHMSRLNRGMRANNIDLICQSNKRQSVLTDIHVCYQGNTFGRCSRPINSCGSTFIISGGK